MLQDKYQRPEKEKETVQLKKTMLKCFLLLPDTTIGNVSMHKHTSFCFHK